MPTFGAKANAWLLPVVVLLLSCSGRQNGQVPTNAVHCGDPRPQICTLDYTPVCATRDNGIRCVTTPCASTETATYANACGACADAAVFYHVPDACDE